MLDNPLSYVDGEHTSRVAPRCLVEDYQEKHEVPHRMERVDPTFQVVSSS
jgi:hypothetical protein